jgi:hypothetical protein
VKRRRRRASPPTFYSEAVIEEICSRMSRGESLPQICRDPAMPNRWTVYDWLKRYPQFLERFNTARQRLYDYWSDDLIAIADDSTKDYDENGRLDEERIARDRVRIDTRKWLLCHLSREKFGDHRLVQTQRLDAFGNPVDPPAIVIPYDEAQRIARELDERV